ncbi:MAG: hypothetical protein FJ171_04135 [Gammaproteobacteria bacterium]|nr:hypothetical protein [Gammaproteobacteria bacterium]
MQTALVTRDPVGSTNLNCWKCGAPLAHLDPPFARTDECRACRAELHVCRLCRFYDTSKAKHCAEPVADEVQNKERANFCGYFEAAPGRFRLRGGGREERAGGPVRAQKVNP